MTNLIRDNGGIEIYEPGTTIKRRRATNAGRAMIILRGVVITETVKEEFGELTPVNNSDRYYLRQPVCSALKNDARLIHALLKGMRRQFNCPPLMSLANQIEKGVLYSVGSTPLFTPQMIVAINEEQQKQLLIQQQQQ